MARISQLGVLGIPGPYYGVIADKAESTAPVAVPRSEPRGGGAGGPRRRGFGGKVRGFDWAARDNTVIPRSRRDGPPEQTPRFKTATVVDLATGEVVEVPPVETTTTETRPKPSARPRPRRGPPPAVIADALPDDTLAGLAGLRRTLVENQERQARQRAEAEQARRARIEQEEAARREAESAALLRRTARATAEKLAARAALAARRREEEEFMLQVVFQELVS